MIRFHFFDGSPLPTGGWALLAQPADDQAADFSFDPIVVLGDGGTTSLEVGYRAVALSSLGRDLVVVGRLGRLTRFRGPEAKEVASIPEVPTYGFLNGARRIGSNVYCVGMFRQVYCLSGDETPIPLHDGILDDRPPGNPVTGLFSIDGLGTDNLWAVGLGGEIWRYSEGGWRSLASPTNLLLDQVRVTPSGDVFAVGQKGTLLRIVGDKVEVDVGDITENDLTGLEWFEGALFMCTASECMRYEPGTRTVDAIPVAPPADGRFSRLRASPEELLLFGGRSVLRTADGATWSEMAFEEL